MLTFRKRVRSASTVISVFSEWPESLGPPALLRRKLYLDSSYRRREKEKEIGRERHSLSRSRSLSPSTCLLLSPSTCPRHDALTPWQSLNSFTEASSDIRRFVRTRVKARYSLCPSMGSLGEFVLVVHAVLADLARDQRGLPDAWNCERNGSNA